MAITNPKPPSNVLIITTSGGGGHIQAAKALEITMQSQRANIVIKDILLEAAGKFFGKKMINIWDMAQRKGHVRTLEFWASGVPVFSHLFFIPIFFQLLYRLFKHQVDRVIDTQPLCLSAIVSAVRIYNFLTKKNIVIEKFLTELPTNYVAHYLKPIKHLNKKNKTFIKLYTTSPLLKNSESPQRFWGKYTGLSEHLISYDDFPIRPSFKKYQNKNFDQESIHLTIHIKSKLEHHLLQDIVQSSQAQCCFEQHLLHLTLPPKDIVSTLMLGSQPAQGATFKYVKKFIELIKSFPSHKNHWLFVFCSQKKFEDVSLQKRIYDLIINMDDFPPYLTIVPMSSQEDDVIAPLFYRSDITLTRSGGVTAMELMAVAKGQIWIHKETSLSLVDKLLKNKKISEFYTYKGMPKWEYGNATYLSQAKGAQIITLESFDEASKNYLLKII